MEGNTFVTTRGDRISLAFGRRPTVGRTGSGPYPRVDEVSEGSELVGDFHLSLSQIVREASVRATLLFSSQHAAERLLALTNPCWSLPIGCSWFTEVESKALLPYTPLKVKIWR